VVVIGPEEAKRISSDTRRRILEYVLAKALNLKLEPSWNTGISGSHLKVIKPIHYCDIWYGYTPCHES